MAEPEGDDGFSRRGYEPGDEVAIATLFRTCFDRDRPIEEWRWRFLRSPAERVDIALVLDGDRLVAHTSRSGFRTFVDGRIAICRQAGDGMTDPEYRGRGVMTELTATGIALPYDLRLNTPTEPSRRIGRGLGKKRFEVPLPQWMAWTGRAGRPLLRSAARRAAGAVTVDQVSAFGSEHDDLADESCAFAPCIRRRDGEYLTWRWLDQPGTSWVAADARDASRALCGFIVYGADPRHDPSGVGRVVDLLARDERTARALLVHAALALGSAGCRKVAFAFHDPRPWSVAACRGAGYFRRGTGPIIAGGPQEDWTKPWADHFESWYLTMGDTDLC